MIDFNFTDHEKRVLSNVGQGAYGAEFIELLQKLRTRLCSIEDLPAGGDHNTEVAARLLFKEFADKLVEDMSVDRRRIPPMRSKEKGSDDFT